MNQVIRFFVRGKPKTQGSKHGFAVKKNGVYTGKVAMVDSCKGLAAWRSDVRNEAEKAWPFPPHEGPVSVEINFFFFRPTGHFGSGKNAAMVKPSAPAHMTTKPDLVKLARAVEDALKGLTWRDDSQIVHEVITKNYSADGQEGANVTIELIP